MRIRYRWTNGFSTPRHIHSQYFNGLQKRNLHIHYYTKYNEFITLHSPDRDHAIPADKIIFSLRLYHSYRNFYSTTYINRLRMVFNSHTTPFHLISQPALRNGFFKGWRICWFAWLWHYVGSLPYLKLLHHWSWKFPVQSDSWSLTSMRISLHSTSLNFLSITPILGAQLFFFTVTTPWRYSQLAWTWRTWDPAFCRQMHRGDRKFPGS